MFRTSAATQAANARLWTRDLDAFLAGCAPTMRASHERNLRRYITCVQANGAATPKSITSAHMQTFVQSLQSERVSVGRVYAPTTVAAILASAKSWHSFLAREHGYANPFTNITTPKLAATPRALQILAPSEIAALRQVAFPQTPTGARDGALLQVLCATGARSRELFALRPFDFLSRYKTLRLGAGETSRVVSIDAEACDALTQYIKIARPTLLKTRDDELPTRRGRPFASEAMSPSARRLALLFVAAGGRVLWPSHARAVVSFAAQQAELPAWIRPATLRHSFAVNGLRTANAESVRRELGARGVAALSRHQNIASDTLLQTVRLHPRG